MVHKQIEAMQDPEKSIDIAIEKNPSDFSENMTIAGDGGNIAGDTRKAIEKKTGKKVIK